MSAAFDIASAFYTPITSAMFNSILRQLVTVEFDPDRKQLLRQRLVAAAGVPNIEMAQLNEQQSLNVLAYLDSRGLLSAHLRDVIHRVKLDACRSYEEVIVPPLNPDDIERGGCLSSAFR